MPSNDRSHNKTPLRVGMLLDSFSQPRWVHKVIEDIGVSPTAELALIIHSDPVQKEQGKLVERIWKQSKHWLYWVYKKADALLFPVTPSAAEKVDIREVTSALPVIRVSPVRHGEVDRFVTEDIATIAEHNLDLILYFENQALEGKILGSARYGVWAFRYGHSKSNLNGLSGFWEVMEGHPVTSSALYMLTADQDEGKLIGRSHIPTHQRSVKRQQNNLYWKSASLLSRKLSEVYEYGSSALDNATSAAALESHRTLDKEKNLSSFHLFSPLLRLGTRGVGSKLRNLVCSEQWVLAVRAGNWPADFRVPLEQLQLIIPPEDREWADPFPVKTGNDRSFVFLEERLLDEKNGHIAVIEIDEAGGNPRSVTVLEKPYHLSYPFIFQWQGDYYMIPETSQNRTIELYRSPSFPHEWRLEKVLLEDIVALDATLADIDGRWWLFAHVREDTITKNHDELHLFYAETPLGPWTPHRRNPVKSDARSARPAGRLFAWEGDLYRPAQDCSLRYGYAISINRIDWIDEERYGETEVSKILPNWAKNIVATHTLNFVDDLLVVDGKLSRLKL